MVKLNAFLCNDFITGKSYKIKNHQGLNDYTLKIHRDDGNVCFLKVTNNVGQNALWFHSDMVVLATPFELVQTESKPIVPLTVFPNIVNPLMLYKIDTKTIFYAKDDLECSNSVYMINTKSNANDMHCFIITIYGTISDIIISDNFQIANDISNHIAIHTSIHSLPIRSSFPLSNYYYTINDFLYYLQYDLNLFVENKYDIYSSYHIDGKSKIIEITDHGSDVLKFSLPVLTDKIGIRELSILNNMTYNREFRADELLVSGCNDYILLQQLVSHNCFGNINLKDNQFSVTIL